MADLAGSGAELAKAYYDEVVHPLVESRWPGLGHAAGRLGSGSDVLGLDDETSHDHDWGLRLTLLIGDDRGIEAERRAGNSVLPVPAEVDSFLESRLPGSYRGLPTRFATTWDPVIRHRVEVAGPVEFARSRLGLDPLAMSTTDWLALTGQSVLEVTAGPLFIDNVGVMTRIRQTLAWYPHEVWLAVVAAEWHRIGQELPFIGRTGIRGDDLGSRVIASRLVGSAMRLAFWIERRWPPYPKWIGTAFRDLPCADDVGPRLQACLTAPGWAQREAELCAALDVLHEKQREAGLPAAEGKATAQFFDREFRGLAGVDDVVRSAITDAALRAPSAFGGASTGRHPAGVEQWIDDVATLCTPVVRVAMSRARSTNARCATAPRARSPR